MTKISIGEHEVSGEFGEYTQIIYGKERLKNKIAIEIGFGKTMKTYWIPDDLFSYKYQSVEKEEESLGKNLLQLGVLAIGGATAVSAADSKGGSRGAKGAVAAGLGGAALRMNTKSKNIYILVHFQFKNRKILSVEMKNKKWKKFDKEYCVVNFPKYEIETQQQKEAVTSQIDLIRENYQNLEPSEQTEATNQLKALSSQLPELDKTLERRRKLATKRNVTLQLESS